MIIATRTALFFLEKNGGHSEPKLLLKELEVRRVIEGNKRNVVALADGSIIILEENEERRRLTTGITDRIDALCLINEKPLDLLIGTTPPYVYRMNEAGSTQRITSFDALNVRDQWYTPWGGPAAVRSLAKSRDGWVYADIHVGSIIRSPDNGKTWQPVNPTLHKDVHEVATTPASDSRVYANTFLAVYISDDRGDSWEHRSQDLDNRYGRGIAVHPEDPDTILCGVSDGPTGMNVHGQLYVTEDAGVTWHQVTSGFPKSTKKNIDTFHIAFTGKDVAWITDEEKLFLSRDRGKTWKNHWQASEEILMISCNI